MGTNSHSLVVEESAKVGCWCRHHTGPTLWGMLRRFEVVSFRNVSYSGGSGYI